LRQNIMHTLAITEQGMHVHIQGDELLLRQGEQLVRRVRLADLNELLLFGRVELSTAALAALVRRRVDVVYLTQQGSFRARVAGRESPSAALRLAQLRCALDPAFCAGVARALVAGKVLHQRQLLLRAQRRLADGALAEVVGRLRLLAARFPQEDDLDRIRGNEGLAAALYFSQFDKLLRTDELTFHGRNRRPPRDPVNACLSFGYALLTSAAESEVLRCGLDPQVGFFHQPHPGRPSLVLDVVEEFRPFVDALVLRLVNRRQLGPLDFERRPAGAAEDDLEVPLGADVVEEADAGAGAAEGVYLADTGRRIYLAEFFRRMRERLYYPPRQGTYELRDIIREQVYHLARVVRGEEAAYVAFVPA
jgi:CRISPR-associated protein Cas1